MVLWAAPGPVFVVPLELGVAGSLAFSTQTRGLDVRLPINTEDANRLALPSPVGFHPNGGDAA
jgi:hypothetical protein